MNQKLRHALILICAACCVGLLCIGLEHKASLANKKVQDLKQSIDKAAESVQQIQKTVDETNHLLYEAWMRTHPGHDGLTFEQWHRLYLAGLLPK